MPDQVPTDLFVCALRLLPRERWIEAADIAVRINPANAPTPLHAFSGLDISSETLAVLTGKYWGSGGVQLTVGFIERTPTDLQRHIVEHMNAWSTVANVRFVIAHTDPQVRISRTRGDGYWSNVGTDILSVPSDEATMNLDSFTMATIESEFIRVVRHETGHTLGFPHEHLRRQIVDRIDRERAIAYFAAPPNRWSRAETIRNVLTPLAGSAIRATADPDPESIMCYSLPASIMRDGIGVPGGRDLSAQDRDFVATVYPIVGGPIDAALLHPNGKAYFFRGDRYQRFDFGERAHVDKVGRIGVDGWPGLWTDLDAALVHPNGKGYFFRGNQYQRFAFGDGRGVDKVGTIGRDGWPGVWADIDAAVVHPNGKAYFFRGGEYQRFRFGENGGVDKVGRIGVDGWPRMWTDIDAALVHPNGKAYFFRGNQYQRFVFGDRGGVDKVGTIGVDGWLGL